MLLKFSLLIAILMCGCSSSATTVHEEHEPVAKNGDGFLAMLNYISYSPHIQQDGTVTDGKDSRDTALFNEVVRLARDVATKLHGDTVIYHIVTTRQGPIYSSFSFFNESGFDIEVYSDLSEHGETAIIDEVICSTDANDHLTIISYSTLNYRFLSGIWHIYTKSGPFDPSSIKSTYKDIMGKSGS